MLRLLLLLSSEPQVAALKPAHSKEEQLQLHVSEIVTNKLSSNFQMITFNFKLRTNLGGLFRASNEVHVFRSWRTKKST